MNEKEVFIQKVSDEEMEAVAGGDDCGAPQQKNCSNYYLRDIYVPSFPNCAATVEDGSWCGSNDACVGSEVIYLDMHDCSKAWR